MSIIVKLFLSLLLLGDLPGHDESEDLEVEKERDPYNIEHEVVAENCQEGLFEMDGNMKPPLPFEPPEPVPAMPGIHMTDACYLPILSAALFKSIICY